MTFDHDAWAKEGEQLAKTYKRLQWEIGDWILKAEPHIKRYESDRIAGCTIPGSDVYSEAEQITGLSRGHLIDLASTARRCPSSVRTDELSWTHHRILINELPEADEATIKEWLGQAVEGHWGKEDLRKQLKGSYTPARLERSFMVKVPLRVWETLKDFADNEKVTVGEIAQRWLANEAGMADTEMNRMMAKQDTEQRRRKARVRSGKRLARNYPLPQNR